MTQKYDTIPVIRDEEVCFADRIREMNLLGYFYHQTSDMVLRKQFGIVGFFIKETVDTKSNFC